MPKVNGKLVALATGQMENLNSSVTKLFMRRVRALECPFTHKDMIDLFAPSNHREILFQAPRVANMGYWQNSDFTAMVGNIGIGVTMYKWHGDPAPMPPKTPVIQPDANPELSEKLTSWVKERTQVGLEFGRVRALLSKLNELCKNPRQMRLVFPSIMVLVTLAERPDIFNVDKFELGSTTQPVLPPKTRDACRMAAATITQSLLLSDELDKDKPTPVGVFIQAKSGFDFDTGLYVKIE